jgi:hypothetical protein
MVDNIDTAVGFVVGFLTVLCFVIRRPVRWREAKPIVPICGCGHHYSFHNDDGCHHVGPYSENCGCVNYYGPEPVPTDFIPDP